MGLRPGQKTAQTFKPGQSGNPGGRRKTPDRIKELCASGAPNVLEMLLEIAVEHAMVPPKKKGDPQRKQYTYDARERVPAGRAFLEYTLPKPQPGINKDAFRALAELARAVVDGEIADPDEEEDEAE
jgi:hypothetical protein